VLQPGLSRRPGSGSEVSPGVQVRFALPMVGPGAIECQRRRHLCQRGPKMAARDEIGSRGEFIFCARIMDFCGRSLPYFRPHFLGEKAQTLDFFVELLDTGERTLFFFAQVKTTRKALTRKDRRLRVEMAAADVRRASQVPAPTYLVGIDERTEI